MTSTIPEQEELDRGHILRGTEEGKAHLGDLTRKGFGKRKTEGGARYGDGMSSGRNRGARSRGQALGEGSEIQLARLDGRGLNSLSAAARGSPWRILREINHHKVLFGPIMMCQALA